MLHIRLYCIFNSKAFFSQVLMHLPHEACLASARNRSVLRVSNSRVEKRFQRELCDMPKELMQYTKQCDVPHLSSHAVPALPDLYWLHVFRILAAQDSVHHLSNVQSYGFFRFKARPHVVCQVCELDFRPRDAGILLNKCQDILSIPFSVFKGLPHGFAIDLMAEFPESLFHLLFFEKALFGCGRAFYLPAGSALLLLSAGHGPRPYLRRRAHQKALRTVPVLSDFCFRTNMKTHLSSFPPSVKQCEAAHSSSRSTGHCCHSRSPGRHCHRCSGCRSARGNARPRSSYR